jgi:hypothetical protein
MRRPDVRVPRMPERDGSRGPGDAPGAGTGLGRIADTLPVVPGARDRTRRSDVRVPRMPERDGSRGPGDAPGAGTAQGRIADTLPVVPGARDRVRRPDLGVPGIPERDRAPQGGRAPRGDSGPRRMAEDLPGASRGPVGVARSPQLPRSVRAQTDGHRPGADAGMLSRSGRPSAVGAARMRAESARAAPVVRGQNDGARAGRGRPGALDSTAPR